MVSYFTIYHSAFGRAAFAMYPFQFMPNSIVAVCGPSQIGKTRFVQRVIDEMDGLYKQPAPAFVVYCYSIWQQAYVEIKEKHGGKVIFHQGLPENDYIKQISSAHPHCLMVLDDTLEPIIDRPEILSLFLEKVHHYKMNLFYILHHLFAVGKNRRTLSLQTQYFVLFPNRVDQLSFEIFARHLGRKEAKEFMDIYNDIKEAKYRYFIVDCHARSESPDFFVWCQVFKDEKTIAYKL